MRTNKMLSVEQWAADIVEASITISRVIVPVGWRTESGKGGGEIKEQTRDRAEKLANTRITLSTTLSFLRERANKTSKVFVRILTLSRNFVESAVSESRRTLELTETLFVSKTKIPKVCREGEDSTKDSWLTVLNRWIV